jgi:hypothetical protein
MAFALPQNFGHNVRLLRRKNMTEKEKKFNKNILIAVDESDNARRAVSYVGQLLGGLPGFKVIILHVVPNRRKITSLHLPKKKMAHATHAENGCVVGRLPSAFDQERI